MKEISNFTKHEGFNFCWSRDTAKSVYALKVWNIHIHFSQTRWDIHFPLEKFAKISSQQEIILQYTPRRKWYCKILSYFFHPHWIFWLETIEFKSPAIKTLGYQSPSSFSPLFLPPLTERRGCKNATVLLFGSAKKLNPLKY